MLVFVAGAFGCNLLTGVADLSLAEAELRSPRGTDGGGIQAGQTVLREIDGGAARSEIPDARAPEAPVVVDAAPYDAGEAGYIRLAGRWTGSWNEDFTIVGGAVIIQLTQAGGALTGTAEIKGGVCPRAGTLSGGFVSANETQGTFTSDDGALVLNLTSTLSDDGTTLNGRFASVGACLPGAFGTTQVTRDTL
jgi:hypothetical protein